MIAIRLERMFSRRGVLEGGVVFARPKQQFGDTTTYVIPEVQAQLQFGVGRVAPYLGAGRPLLARWALCGQSALDSPL